ncbi:MAG TPA: hypothetical protein VGG03_15240 [Thermoanaerobaculia bacterium]
MKRALLPIAIAAASFIAGCGGKQIPVARVEVDPRQVRLPFSQARPLHLTWTPSVALGEEQPTVFVHLLDGQRKVIRTFDHPFPQRWREGAAVSYDVKLYQSALAPPLAPGKYQLTLGLYGRDGRRWALDGLGEPKSRNEYDVAEVEVPAQKPSPRFVFSPTWLPVEPGGDRQVLARRWMAERAVIRLLHQREPGTVWMLIKIPPANTPDAQLILEPGASTPSLLVAGSCGGTETNLTGPGIHEVELAMDAPPPTEFCRVLLSANFLLQPTVGRKRSVSLENIAWIPADSGRQGPAPAGTGGGETATPTAPQ